MLRYCIEAQFYSVNSIATDKDPHGLNISCLQCLLHISHEIGYPAWYETYTGGEGGSTWEVGHSVRNV